MLEVKRYEETKNIMVLSIITYTNDTDGTELEISSEKFYPKGIQDIKDKLKELSLFNDLQKEKKPLLDTLIQKKIVHK